MKRKPKTLLIRNSTLVESSSGSDNYPVEFRKGMNIPILAETGQKHKYDFIHDLFYILDDEKYKAYSFVRCGLVIQGAKCFMVCIKYRQQKEAFRSY